MNLFDLPFDAKKNLLPYEGEVYYYGKIFTEREANRYYQCLLEQIQWQQDEAIIFGKLIKTARKVAWYGDRAFPYTYSKRTKWALPWLSELIEMKEKVEEVSEDTYNSCLLNLYHSGMEGMAWHSDAEKDLKAGGAIASLTFGAERKFAFKHKMEKKRIEVILEHGSLLIMKGSTQKHWLHRLPPTKKIADPRINLTFRTIVSKQ